MHHIPFDPFAVARLPLHRTPDMKVINILLFQRTIDPLHLHSFPTRRSSDLTTRSSPPISGKHRTKAQEWLRGTKIKDRKSTRLNSSHVSISYAVFCMKKKNHLRSKPTEREGFLTTANGWLSLIQVDEPVLNH